MLVGGNLRPFRWDGMLLSITQISSQLALTTASACEIGNNLREYCRLLAGMGECELGHPVVLQEIMLHLMGVSEESQILRLLENAVEGKKV